MLIVPSSSIAPDDLKPLLEQGIEIVFADTQCQVAVNPNGDVVGDSPYGYVDFFGKASDANSIIDWSRSWLEFNPSRSYA